MKVRAFLIPIMLLMAMTFPDVVKATHIAGGEIYYEYVRSGRYRITLKLYIDCENGQQGAINTDSIAIIGFYNADTKDLIDAEEISRTGPNRIRETNYSCVNNQPRACVDEYTYQFEKDLDPGSDGIVVTFQRCCRNGTISNLQNPQNLGATYWCVIPPTTEVTQNSSAIYNKLPPNFLCTDAPLVFDHSASDADGDSLVYSIVRPFNGGNRVDNRPNPPRPPDYNRVPLSTPYTIQDMMGGSVKLQINDSTGELRVTPDKVGQYVVGILVEEFRNGELVGWTLRDYQFNVFVCDLTTQANFINPRRICNDSAQFSDLSKDVEKYHWDFGVDGIDYDTSDVAEPLWLYTDEGTYKVTLKVQNGNCIDSFYNYITVVFGDSIYAKYIAEPDSACDKLTTLFTNQSDKTPYWRWDMDDGSAPLINTDPGEYVFDEEGTYSVRLIIEDSTRCNIRDTFIRDLVVHVVPEADFEIGENLCDGQVRFDNQSTFSNVWRWRVIGESDIDSSVNEDPVIDFKKGGKYNIELISRNLNCADTVVKQMDIPYIPTLDATINAKPLQGCVPLPVNISVMTTDSAIHYWDMGDGNIFVDTLFGTYFYTQEGSFTMKHIIVDSTSCNTADTAEILVNTKTLPVAAFDYKYDPCTGVLQLVDLTQNGTDYLWDIGGKKYTTSAPKLTLEEDTEIQMSLTLDSGSICPATYVRKGSFRVSQFGDLFIPNVFTPGYDGMNDCFTVGNLDADCYTFEMKIYNRWGELVFENLDALDCWRGESRYTHKKYPAGVYFGVYKFKNISTGEEYEYTNSITLIR